MSREESGLDELFAPPPDEDPDEGKAYRHDDLEHQSSRTLKRHEPGNTDEAKETKSSRFLIQVYIHSYLVCFSIFGVLARIGLQALTLYPAALIPNTDLWADFAGCLTIGFLREDRTLFRRHWQKAQSEHEERMNASTRLQGSGTDHEKQETDGGKAAVEAAFRASRGQIPGYLGLTVGFCGSFTSFASICRDSFLAISNNINTDDTANHFVTFTARSREAGYSVMAILAVLLLEIGMSIIALKIGAHLAIMTERLVEDATANVNFPKILNPLSDLLALSVWTGAIILTIFGPHDAWRGKGALLSRLCTSGLHSAVLAVGAYEPSDRILPTRKFRGQRARNGDSGHGVQSSALAGGWERARMPGLAGYCRRVLWSTDHRQHLGPRAGHAAPETCVCI